jgi:hypothetical protein
LADPTGNVHSGTRVRCTSGPALLELQEIVRKMDRAKHFERNASK